MVRETFKEHFEKLLNESADDRRKLRGRIDEINEEGGAVLLRMSRRER